MYTLYLYGVSLLAIDHDDTTSASSTSNPHYIATTQLYRSKVKYERTRGYVIYGISAGYDRSI